MMYFENINDNDFTTDGGVLGIMVVMMALQIMRIIMIVVKVVMKITDGEETIKIEQ